MQVTCPKCSAKVDIDPGERDDKGRVRLRCGECDAKLLIKVKAPALKLDGGIPSSESVPAIPPEAAPLAAAPAVEPTPPPATRSGGGLDLGALTLDTGVEGDSVDVSTTIEAAWVVVVDRLDEGGISELRRVMMRIGRFKRNPNKLHDLTSDLPFVLNGVSEDEARQLNATIDSLLGACRAGPEVELLDSEGKPFPAPEEPLEIAGEAYDEASGELVVAGGADDDDEPEPEEGLVVAGEADEDEEADELEAGHVEDASTADVLAAVAETVPVAEPEPEPETETEEGLVVAGGEEEDDDDEPGEAFADTVAIEPTPEVLPEPKRAAISADDLSGVDLSVADSLGDVGFTTPPPEPAASEPIEMGDLMGGDNDDTVRNRQTPQSNGVLLATVDQFPGLDDILGLVSVSVVIAVADLDGRNRAVKLEAALNAAMVGLKRNATEQGAAAVVGVRTTTASLPDGSVLLVMQGTATA